MTFLTYVKLKQNELIKIVKLVRFVLIFSAYQSKQTVPDEDKNCLYVVLYQ